MAKPAFTSFIATIWLIIVRPPILTTLTWQDKFASKCPSHFTVVIPLVGLGYTFNETDTVNMLATGATSLQPTPNSPLALLAMVNTLMPVETFTHLPSPLRMIG